MLLKRTLSRFFSFLCLVFLFSCTLGTICLRHGIFKPRTKTCINTLLAASGSVRPLLEFLFLMNWKLLFPLLFLVLYFKHYKLSKTHNLSQYLDIIYDSSCFVLSFFLAFHCNIKTLKTSRQRMRIAYIQHKVKRRFWLNFTIIVIKINNIQQ